MRGVVYDYERGNKLKAIIIRHIGWILDMWPQLELSRSLRKQITALLELNWTKHALIEHKIYDSELI